MRINNSEKIVITGLGSCTAAGKTQELWEASLRKQVHLTKYTEKTISDCPVEIVGKVTLPLTFIFPAKVQKYVSRHTQLAAVALQECIEGSGISDVQNAKTGLLFGSASIGQDQLESLFDDLKNKSFKDINSHKLSTITDAGACHVLASHFGINGYVHAVEGSSCSGLITIVTAYHLIKSGLCDRIFCVVGEANIFPPTFLFYARRVRVKGITFSFFGKNPSSERREIENHVIPFCIPELSDRGVIAEAGCALLLESHSSAQKRNAPIFAELEDVSLKFYSESFHGTDPNYKGIIQTVKKFESCHLDSCYVPATGNYILDIGTYSALSMFFKNKHIYTVEPIIGHTGAASSLVNCILACFSLKNNMLLPTKNYNDKMKDPDLLLNPCISVRKADINRILILSSGWGGYNAGCLIKKWE